MKRFSVGNWRQDRILSRVLRNSTYLFASYVLGAVLTFVTARLLGVASFGALGTVTVIVANINRLFSFRMGDLVVKYMGESLALNNPLRAAAVAKAAMMIEALTSVLAFAALFFVAPLGAAIFLKDPDSILLFQIYGTSILFSLVAESSIGVLQVTDHFRSQALINFFQTALVAVLLGIAAIYQANLLTVLYIYLAGKVILGVGPAVMAFYWLPRTLGKDWWRAPFSALPPWREMARFAVSTNVNGTVNLVARDSEVPIVSFFFGTLAAGYFKISLALINLIVLVINPFISTSYPEITRAFSARNWPRLRSLLRRLTLISAGWTSVVAFGLMLFGRPLLFSSWTLFGRTFDLLAEYTPAYPVMLVLLVGYGTANIFFWNRPLLLAQGLAIYPLKVGFWAMLLKVFLMVLILPQLSAQGYVVQAALLSGYLLITVLMNVRKGLLEIQRSEAGGSALLQGEPV
jgi:O-antigen/teichoic acid export membrane protein